MSKKGGKATFGDDADIFVVDDTMGEIDTTRRPLEEPRRSALLKQLQEEAEIRRMLEKERESGSGNDDTDKK